MAATPSSGIDFGIDAPRVVQLFGVAGAVLAVIGIVLAIGQGPGAVIGPFIAAALCFGAMAYMIRSSRVAKPRIWDRELDALELRGDERALDLGCGRGLVTVALAQRLPRGSVVGTDIWRPRDQSGNSRANAEANLAAAGVADLVELVDADHLDLPFPDAEFDLVTASLSLHALPLAKERKQAMAELMRVTRPGGRIVILDLSKTIEFEAWLHDAGWDDIDKSPPSLAMYPPVRTLAATRPRRSANKKR